MLIEIVRTPQPISTYQVAFHLEFICGHLNLTKRFQTRKGLPIEQPLQLPYLKAPKVPAQKPVVKFPQSLRRRGRHRNRNRKQIKTQLICLHSIPLEI